jgi:PAS domain S-box-containing protein
MNKRILILVALVTALFTGKTLLDIVSDRKQVIVSAERLSRGFANALNEHAIRTFSSAENTMDAFIHDIQVLFPRGIPEEKKLYGLLAGYMRKSPFSPVLFVAAPNGRLHSASSEYPVRAVFVSDREYFQHHLNNPDNGVFISRPHANRLTGARLIFLTKRLSNPDGSLRMVVGISIDPHYFSDFYRTIELGKHDRIFLFRKDGAILTLEPFYEAFMDKTLSTSQLIQKEIPGEPHAGTLRMEQGAVDKTSRIVSYRFSGHYPVVSIVSLHEGDVLARWSSRSLKSGGGALLLVALVGGLGLVVYRQIRELKQREDKYSLIVTTANEGIWMLDGDARVVYVNPRVVDMFGYQPDEMAGRLVGDFMCPDELPDHETRMQLRKQGVAERYERRFLHKDGTEVWTVISATALIDDEEGFQGVVAMCVDISDQKKSEKRQERLEEELRQAHKMEAVGIMAGGMAHDFNNLLQSILGYVFLAKMGAEPDSEVLEYLDEAEKISGQVCELGQRLLLLSRGGVTMLRSSALPPLILSLVSSALEGTSVTGEYDLPMDMPLVTIDESLMKQVVFHLTTNAIEAMAQGGTLRISGATVTISSKHELPMPPGVYVHISFSDTGAGIAAAHLNRIFDPYFTTKEKRSEKGMGLGLALCHTIIRKHKGMINASSCVGEGATFNIYLPVTGADAPPPLPLQDQ